jgi:hypothetical protein
MKITDLAEAIQRLMTVTANRLGRETGFIQRERVLTGGKFAQTVVFGLMGNPAATRDELAQAAATVGVNISTPGLDKRFTPQAATFLLALLQAAVEQVVRADEEAVSIFAHFNGVYVEDCSTITLPDTLAPVWAGCGGAGPAAGVKMAVEIDLKQGQLRGPFLYDGRTHDQRTAVHGRALPPGALRLMDLGFFDLDTLAADSAQDVYWFSRLKAGTSLYTEQGEPLDLVAWLKGSAVEALDLTISLGAQHRLPCRLMALRVPPGVVGRRRKRLLEDARRKGRPVSPERLALVGWTLYITNAPPTLISLSQAPVVGATRWQIEILFKVWKSDGRIDEARTAAPWRLLCELYAKLIALLIQHWLLLVSGWYYPDRSLHQAHQVVRIQAFHLASVLSEAEALCFALTVIQRAIVATCHMNTRHAQPLTYQLWAQAHL